ncbi:hypothetical protein PIB30_054365 [Stylosanthes scabra]|uniref:Large ribosomal subunit protein uL2 C-terminal domain-containing protein n=1 Tax=Stylosanthes scabra TaxID=79078 RepID=A0ABU6ZHG2_9FABA|nr:hypothetical protein [Stylosanthes scabra]
MAKEIEEIKKFQVNQTLMGFRRDPIEKLEKRIHKHQNEIIDMRAQIKEWTKNASSREAYCCWAHQQANPNLVEIPTQKIPEFVHKNAAKGKHIFHGALKSHNQGEPSQPADQPMEEIEKAGAVAKLIAKEGKSTTLKLPSGEVRLISKNCSATVGQVGNVGVNQKTLGRAGKSPKPIPGNSEAS